MSNLKSVTLYFCCYCCSNNNNNYEKKWTWRMNEWLKKKPAKHNNVLRIEPDTVFNFVRWICTTYIHNAEYIAIFAMCVAVAWKRWKFMKTVKFILPYMKNVSTRWHQTFYKLTQNTCCSATYTHQKWKWSNSNLLFVCAMKIFIFFFLSASSYFFHRY